VRGWQSGRKSAWVAVWKEKCVGGSLEGKVRGWQSEWEGILLM